jgi:hypothetical protein
MAYDPIHESCAGVEPSVLQDVTLEIGELAGNTLAVALGKTIRLSADTAHWSWYVNANPVDDNYPAPTLTCPP